jgi:hypothetical protein
MVDASNFQKLELFRDPNNNDTFVARDPSDGSTFAVPFDSIEANSLSVSGTSFDEKADLTGTNGVLKSTQVPDLRQGCRVFLSVDQSISAASNTKIQFDSEVYDSDSNFDTSSHNWTCPKDGLYAVNLQVQFSGGGLDETRNLFIGTATNNAPPDEGGQNRQNSSDTDDILSVSTINKYSTGDTIAGYAENTTSADTVRSGSANFGTFLEVAFLGGL